MSLDPINLPNTITDLPTASSASFELNLDDYAWSVSSLGPYYDSDVESAPSEARVPSVHLDRRAVGSVTLTPSVCTTFGWNDEDEIHSIVSNVSRLPSPDIAGRALSDAPLTPATVTSWGPPSYLASPMLAGSPRAPSIDIARRHMYSQPVTPLTATSWGPPSYPNSPRHSQYALRSTTPDIAERVPSSSSGPFVSQLRPSSSYQNQDLTEQWAQGAIVATSREETGRFPEEEISQPFEFVFPYYRPLVNHEKDANNDVVIPEAESEATPWAQVWPYTKDSGSVAYGEGKPSRETATPWALVWPYAEAVPAATPWKQVWPYREAISQEPVVGCQYPYFNICKASLYPRSQNLTKVVQTLQCIRTSDCILPSCTRLLALELLIHPVVIRTLISVSSLV